MKPKINLAAIFILILSFGSCSEENDLKIDNKNMDQNKIVKTPDFRAILLGGNKASEEFDIGFYIETESDYVSSDGEGCHTVNVRVYMTSTIDGVRYLVANDNAVICEDTVKGNINSNIKLSNNCNGKLEDGSYIVENNTTVHICLYEILIKNKEAYQQYQESVKNLIENL